jgi:hypothetical protein
LCGLPGTPSEVRKVIRYEGGHHATTQHTDNGYLVYDRSVRRVGRGSALVPAQAPRREVNLRLSDKNA